MKPSLARLRNAVVIAAVLHAGGWRAVHAQDYGGPRHAWVESFRDSLHETRDLSALRTLESQTLATAKARKDDPALHLRLGLVALRIADVAGDPGHFSDAATEFQWAAEIQPTWAEPWFGLGLAQLGMAEAENPFVRAVETKLGKDPALKSVDAFVRSAAADPDWSGGLPAFGTLAAQKQIAGRLTAALEALRRAAPASNTSHPDLSLGRVRAENATGNPDSALAVLRPLLERYPRNAAALLELARTRFIMGQADGIEPWYRGLALADRTALALYRHDLESILPDSTLRGFDTASGEARAALVRRFWDSRDHDDLHSDGERLREHYRRLEYARRNFMPDRRYDMLQPDVPGWTEFDDRGTVYVHLGPPDARASLSLIGVPANESWLYHRKGQEDVVLNFVVHDGDASYRLVESILDVLALTKQSIMAHRSEPGRLTTDTAGKPVETYGAAWVAGIAEELLYSRESFPIYAKMIFGGKRQAVALQAHERALGKEGIDLGLHSDRWTLTYELPLAASVDLVAVGSDAAGTIVQLAFAIPGEAITPVKTDRGYLYTVRTRATFLGADGRIVAAVDTVRGFVSHEWIAPDGQLLARLPIHVPPGAWTVRMALETEGRGVVTPRQGVDVSSLDGPSLSISDLALGSRKVKLPLLGLRGDTAWINPLHTFSKNEPMQLYFELAGLTPGARYHTELTVIRPPRSGIFTTTSSALMKLGFDGTKGGDVDPIQRELSLDKLSPGSYVLEVTISTADGQRAVRRRAFTVIK